MGGSAWSEDAALSRAWHDEAQAATSAGPHARITLSSSGPGRKVIRGTSEGRQQMLPGDVPSPSVWLIGPQYEASVSGNFWFLSLSQRRVCGS